MSRDSNLSDPRRRAMSQRSLARSHRPHSRGTRGLRPGAYPVASVWRSRCAPGDFAVSRRLVEGAEAEQGLEGGHWRAAAVVAEDELVEVDGQMVVGDAAVGAVHPGLEVRDRDGHGAGRALADGRP